MNFETGVELIGVDFSGNRVVIAESMKDDLFADIIVGANGRHSSIRQCHRR